MKLKLLLLVLLLPFVSFGASTNKIDNLWVPSSARFTFGTPAAGEVLTSDAAGFATWSPIPVAPAGGDVFTMSNNTFIVGRTNTFNGQTTTSNLLVLGFIVATNANTSTNWFGRTAIKADAANNEILILTDRDGVAIEIMTRTSADGGGVRHTSRSGTAMYYLSDSGLHIEGGGLTVEANSGNFTSILSQSITLGSSGLPANINMFGTNTILGFVRPASPQTTITNLGSYAITNRLFLPLGSASNSVWTSINTTTGEGAWRVPAFSSTNQIPTSYSMDLTTVGGNSNFVTFAHGVVPSNQTLTIRYVQSIDENGNAPGTTQVVRVFNATTATTLLVTNGNWVGFITIPETNRWYARFENNSATNIAVNASVHGFMN